MLPNNKHSVRDIVLTLLRKISFFIISGVAAILGLAFFVSFPKLFQLSGTEKKHIQLDWNSFFTNFKETLAQFTELTDLSYSYHYLQGDTLDRYQYSYSIFGTSLLIVILGGLMIAFLIMLLPYKFRNKLIAMINIFSGVPDLVFIFLFNMLHIFLFREYRIKLFVLYGFGNIKPFLFPVIIIAILPIILFAGYLIKSMADEEEEQYILTGLSKGLSRLYIYPFHMARNILPIILIHFRTIVFTLLTNLVLVEHMYFIDGFSKELITQMNSGLMSLFYGVALFVLPVLLLELLCIIYVKTITVTRKGKLEI
jgi:peptide/nickel transport system permease protein